VNRQIARLFTAFALGFALLIGFTGYWQLWADDSLKAHRDNLTEVVHQLSIKRGLILAHGGTILARNKIRTDRDGRKVYLRVYPTKGLFAHVVGYSSPSANRAGLELEYNDYLTGSSSDLTGTIENAFSSIGGGTAVGDDVITSLDPAIQRIAQHDLIRTGHRGAVVAIEVKTGRVLAVVSWPSFDPNLAVNSPGRWSRFLHRSSGTLFDRALQGRYPPGSTFKTVTAAAALESGRWTVNSTFVDRGFFTEYGVPIRNSSGEGARGRVDMTTALTHSINAVFAQLGWELCKGKPVCPALTDQMQRFGFYKVPPIDVPDGEKVGSGILTDGRLSPPKTPIDPARTAIGQYRLGATPLQMAMVAQAIANGGMLLRPTLVDRVRAPSRSIVFRRKTEELGRAVTAANAAAITQMMTHVVEEGTGRPAAIPGVQIAGKTGTAQTGAGNLNDAWFMSFAPADDPKVAVAVVVEDTTAFGGAIAAPIAKHVMQVALGQKPS
jgi:penicillin-binding protein A